MKNNKKIANLKEPVKVADFDTLRINKPERAKLENTDLVVTRYNDKDVSVLYGRCLHRGALLSDGYINGANLICGVHKWDFRVDTGISEYNPKEKLHKFTAVINSGGVYIDKEEVLEFERNHPSPFNSESYLGDYQDTHPEPTEPYTKYVKGLAANGLKSTEPHGAIVAMGVDRRELPSWDNIQILPAQFARRPLFDRDVVNTKTIIGPKAKKPLELSMPIFVSDMSFGALSKPAKIALAKGAQMCGTGIASGEGGMLKEEQEENSRYFYEFASGKFGFSWEKVQKVQAFHFKGGQGAKAGVGGHLPGDKVTKDIAEARGLSIGESAISPATFVDLKTVKDFKEFVDEVREKTGGIPIGFKLAASHIEEDIDFALEVGADYIILDGRGGSTGATPSILRDNICVPTIPALARARRHLDLRGSDGVSLVITGGLRIAPDFVKALALGADAIAVANSAIQAVGCIGMRACQSNYCPVGVATQKEGLVSRLIIDKSAGQLKNFLEATNELMKVLSRALGHNDLKKFNQEDLTTFDYDMHKLTGINYAGF